MEYIVTFFVLVLVLSYILSASIVINFLMLILAEILIYYTPFGETYEYYLRVMSLVFIHNGLRFALIKYVAKQNGTYCSGFFYTLFNYDYCTDFVALYALWKETWLRARAYIRCLRSNCFFENDLKIKF
jgi:hypothetical protein